jgi:hypothetical protein
MIDQPRFGKVEHHAVWGFGGRGPKIDESPTQGFPDCFLFHPLKTNPRARRCSIQHIYSEPIDSSIGMVIVVWRRVICADPDECGNPSMLHTSVMVSGLSERRQKQER